MPKTIRALLRNDALRAYRSPRAPVTVAPRYVWGPTTCPAVAPRCATFDLAWYRPVTLKARA